MAFEIGPVILLIGVQRGRRGFAKRIQPVAFRCIQQQWIILGPDIVVRCHHAGLAVAPDFRTVDIIQDFRSGPEFQHHPSPAVSAQVIGEQPAQDRCDFGNRGNLIRQPRRGKDWPAVFLQAYFGQGHRIDHPLIGFLRGIAEREDAVLVQDQSLHIRRVGMDFGCRLRQRETRHDVGYITHALAIDIAADILAIRLVRQAEHRRGMGVVDKFMRQEGMQQGFYRRIRRCGIQQIATLEIYHVLIAERVQRLQPAQRFEAPPAGPPVRYHPCPNRCP